MFRVACLIIALHSSLCLGQIEGSAVVNQVTPSIVVVSAQKADGVSRGIGIIVSPDGRIATSLDVIKGAQSASVTLVTGETHPLTSVLAFHPRAGLALIKIQAAEQFPLRLGDSDTVAVGHTAMVIGNAGDRAGRGTAAVIRTIRDNPLDKYHRIIETDAAIDETDIGAPLVDSSGRAVGIVVAGHSPGVFSAVPINFLRGYLAQPTQNMSLSEFRSRLANEGRKKEFEAWLSPASPPAQ